MVSKTKYSWLFAAAIVIIILSFNACKKKEEKTQYPISIDFYIRYLSEGDQFNSLCKVSYADSLAMGESDTTSYQITIGNKDMKEIIASNGRKHYNLQTKMPYAESYQVNIKNPEGEIYSQKCYLSSIDSVRPEKNISITKGGRLSWFGKSLTDSESIIVMIVGEDGKLSSFTTNGPSTVNELIIKPETLTGLKTGKADLYLVRTTNQDIKKELRNFYFRNEYFSKTYKVEVVK